MSAFDKKKIEFHNEGVRIYRKFFDKCIILNENMRQVNDMLWKLILRRVRSGICTQDDLDMLSCKVITPLEKMTDPWKTCPRYTSLNIDVDQCNEECINNDPNLKSQIFDVSGYYAWDDSHAGRIADKDEVLSFISRQLYNDQLLKVAVGAPVMVTENLSHEKKIINGTIGTVVGVVGRSGRKADYILVQFGEEVSVPDLQLNVGGRLITYHNTYPIQRKCTGHSKNRKRSNSDAITHMTLYCSHFPLTLAYALTIHKAQGLTVDNAIVELNTCRNAQQPYVAMSRVRSLEGIRFATMPTLSSLNKMNGSREQECIDNEMNRLKILQENVLNFLGMTEDDNRIQLKTDMEEYIYEKLYYDVFVHS